MLVYCFVVVFEWPFEGVVSYCSEWLLSLPFEEDFSISVSWCRRLKTRVRVYQVTSYCCLSFFNGLYGFIWMS